LTAHSEYQKHGEQNGREKRYAAKARYSSLLYFSRINLIKKILAESDQKNLRNDKSRQHYDNQKNCYVNVKPMHYQY
ncbi:MAG: hypothetical protein K2K36_07995, partial [Muribaculaceae bacterium]|nr:hypothetical protein [Muribaculaceae bacterium]